MPIRIEHGGVTYTVDTPEEATRLVDHLHKYEDMKAQQEGQDADLRKVIPNTPGLNSLPVNPWSKEVFWDFVTSLGPSQKAILSTLLIYGGSNDGVSDELLRKEAGVGTNQALAGILSGLSKQAARLGLSPRDVFWFQSSRGAARSNRARRSVYHIDLSFLAMACELHWPPGFDGPDYTLPTSGAGKLAAKR